jgi:hypothetical protein
MLWCASDTSPGMGMWPPPIQPTSAMVWGATGPGGDVGSVAAGHTGGAVDAGGLDGLGRGHVRQDGGQRPSICWRKVYPPSRQGNLR